MFIIKKNISKPKFFGFLFGLILILTQINIVYGLPLVLFSLIIFSEKIALNKKDRLLFFFTTLQLLWFLMMFVLFPVNFNHWVKHFALFLIIFIIIVSKIDFNFINGICISLSLLLLLDFAFNLTTIFAGVDPFGRIPITRPDDFLPRLGGVFGHSFFSLNISFLGIISACFKRNKSILLLSIFNILLIGILRGFILLIILLIAFLIIRKGVSFFKIKIYSFLIVLSVFAITVYSVTLNFSTANVMRVFAWSNAINNISLNPFYGKQDFYSDDIETISFETIENFGVTESQYLEVAVHYGVFPSLLFFIIMTLMLQKSYNEFVNPKQLNSQTKIILISTFIIFIDTFYGSIFGGPLTSVFLTLLIFSTNKNITN